MTANNSRLVSKTKGKIMGPGSLDECLGCMYEESDDIRVHLEYCSHCSRAYYNEEDRELNEDKFTPIFQTRRLGNFKPIFDCNSCAWLNITEEDQEQLYKEQHRMMDHICHYYNKRVIHRGSSKQRNEYLYPCIDCMKEGCCHFKKRS